MCVVCVGGGCECVWCVLVVVVNMCVGGCECESVCGVCWWWLKRLFDKGDWCTFIYITLHWS